MQLTLKLRNTHFVFAAQVQNFIYGLYGCPDLFLPAFRNYSFVFFNILLIYFLHIVLKHKNKLHNCLILTGQVFILFLSLLLVLVFITIICPLSQLLMFRGRINNPCFETACEFVKTIDDITDDQ